jgi:hypothetical protein
MDSGIFRFRMTAAGTARVMLWMRAAVAGDDLPHCPAFTGTTTTIMLHAALCCTVAFAARPMWFQLPH